MTEQTNVLHELPCHWQGVDDSTPAGCTLYATTVLGVSTTYILRNGQVIGRIEFNDGRQNGYVGAGLKGGAWVGMGDSASLGQKIADLAGKEA